MAEEAVTSIDRIFGTTEGVPYWWRQKHVLLQSHIDHSKGDRYDLSHEELGISIDSLLQSGLRSDQVSVSKDRVRRHSTEYTREVVIAGRHVSDVVSPSRLRRLIENGCTAILANCEEWVPRCAEVALELKARFESEIEAHVFATGPLAQGLTAHSDGEDNLLIQLSGSKTWRLWGTEQTTGRYFADETELGLPTAEIELSVGDILYIPVGWVHSGIASSQGSIHITYQVIPKMAADVVLDHARAQLSDDLRTVLAPCDSAGRESLLALSANLCETAQKTIQSWAQQQESGNNEDDLLLRERRH